jgi:hypothetical protein
LKLIPRKLEDLGEVWDFSERWEQHLLQSRDFPVYFTMTSQWMGLAADLWGGLGEIYLLEVERDRGLSQYLLWRLTSGSEGVVGEPILPSTDLNPLWRFPVTNAEFADLIHTLRTWMKSETGSEEGVLRLPVYDAPLPPGITGDNHALGSLSLLTDLQAFGSVDQWVYQVPPRELRKQLLKAERAREVELEIIRSPGAVSEEMDFFMDHLNLSVQDRGFLSMVYRVFAQKGWLAFFYLRLEGWLVAAASLVQFGKSITVHRVWEQPYEYRIPFRTILSWYILDQALANGVESIYNLPVEIGIPVTRRSLRIPLKG